VVALEGPFPEGLDKRPLGYYIYCESRRSASGIE